MEKNLFDIKIASETTNLDIGDIEGQFLENQDCLRDQRRPPKPCVYVKHMVKRVIRL